MFLSTLLIVSSLLLISSHAEDIDGLLVQEVKGLHSFPRLTYGTAWKKDATADLVYHAVRAGFRHIDTACQPKHYNEAGVGEGWNRAALELELSRTEIWLQTKYTATQGQDLNNPIPYDPTASKRDQVRQSVDASLLHLQTDYLDSLVMHGMEDEWEDTFKVWTAFEELVDAGTVRQLGISNIYHPPALQYLYENVRIKPAVVQNRFYGDSNYDVAIRAFCVEHHIEYQSFWTLGANRHFVGHDIVRKLATLRRVSPEAILYALVMKLGHTPLDGTTSQQHMKEDIDLLQRIQGGEEIISDDDLPLLIQILGIPPAQPEEEAEEL
mmetsp:Transcript_30722/g.34333  ORF Transcript_30722/g.34333 Transcript_30722/m.34333 type:complete len:325 (+) Transcript_30722:109-1083(+)